MGWCNWEAQSGRWVDEVVEQMVAYVLLRRDSIGALPSAPRIIIIFECVPYFLNCLGRIPLPKKQAFP